jgi:hypothetical protein
MVLNKMNAASAKKMRSRKNISDTINSTANAQSAIAAFFFQNHIFHIAYAGLRQ